MNTPRTDAELNRNVAHCGSYSASPEFARQLETELAAMTKERDAFRVAFCNGPVYDTGETPEQARERWDKEAFIEGVSAVLIARQAIKERDAEREKVAKLRDEVSKLRRVANHSPNCARALTVFKPCDCGLDETMEATK